MAQLSCVRIDAHLIHGQVRNVWLKRFPSKVIVLIDNPIAADPFLSQVHAMACPVGCKLLTLSTKDAAEQWKRDKFGILGPVFVVMGDIKTAHETYRMGFDFPELMVGCLSGTTGSGPVLDPFDASDAEKQLLKALEEQGCKVSFQNIPAEYSV